MKTLIIGGVAGGASCAARLRRLDETAQIVLFERGEYISYANCGLPYHVGNVIEARQSLLLQTPEMMRARFNIDVRVRNEVTAINRADKTVTVTNHATGEAYTESYDKLVIATGSSPLRPRIPGIESDRIRTLWTVPDTDELRTLVHGGQVKNVAVIGGGFIGLEMAENLRHAGLNVSLIEAADQVMAPLDYEMALLLHDQLRTKGVHLHLGDGVSSFTEDGDTVTVQLQSGAAVRADLVILSIGVRPNSELAKAAGLSVNERGGIITNDHLLTNDPDIYAVGDVIEVEDFVCGGRTMVPLAGPANKQGRIVANLLAGIDDRYTGTQGSSVAKIFDLTAAATGANEKTLQRRGMRKGEDYETLTITQNSHAGYYPGAVPMTLKVIFAPDTGKLYGAQIVGMDGVDKRIDTLGVALRLGAKVTDLADLELAYAPPYSSAKDPVNMAGFVAENLLAGHISIAAWNAPDTATDAVLLDVREEAETLGYSIPNAVNIPLGKLRDSLSTLDTSRQYIIFCAIGVRAYNAARILMQHGFANVSVYPGGNRFYQATHPEATEADDSSDNMTLVSDANTTAESGTAPASLQKVSINCSGLQCPGPIMEVFKKMKELQAGETLEVTASDPGFARDIVSWCRRTGNTLLSNETKDGKYIALIQKTSAGSAEQTAPTCSRNNATETLSAGKIPNASMMQPAQGFTVQHGTPELPQGKTIIVFDGDLDKVLASFVIANGALAMGRPVTMFFTFWGLTALRRENKVPVKKTLVEKMFGFMLPRGTKKLKLSQMNMGGMGTKMMRSIMQDKNIDSLEDMMKKAMENGVKIIACSMSMDVMGIHPEELIDGVEIGGVGTYLGDAEESNVNLFI